jgi:predicted transcriptional regulator
MRLVWRENLRTVAEVTERVNVGRAQPLDYRTILTVMSRLTKKRLLRHRRRGNTYYFSATCSEEEFAARQGAAAVIDVLNRFGEKALPGILGQLAATPDVLARLRSLAEELEHEERNEATKD